MAWWTANITGNDDDFKKKEDAQNKIDAALADKTAFGKLKALKAAKDKGEIADKLAARQVELLYLQYLEKQVPPDLLKKITAKANAVEQSFNVFRAKIDGQEFAASKVRNVTRCRNTLGERGVLGVRLQPNHPTDDVVGILLSVADGLAFGCGDLLLFLHLLDCRNQVTKTRRFFKAHFFRRQTHAPAQLTSQILVAAFQEEPDVANSRGVRFVGG